MSSVDVDVLYGGRAFEVDTRGPALTYQSEAALRRLWSFLCRVWVWVRRIVIASVIAFGLFCGYVIADDPYSPRITWFDGVWHFFVPGWKHVCVVPITDAGCPKAEKVFDDPMDERRFERIPPLGQVKY